jgi:hypothetical protein
MIFLGNDKGYSYKINGNTGVTSIFKRFVQVEPFVVNGEPVGSEEGARVRVKVEWKDAYGPKEVNIQENIYNFL